MTQTFRVNIDLYSYDILDTFISTLCEHGSPRIVSYEVAPDDGYGSTMVVEFTSYEDALRFAQHWFGVSHWSGGSGKDPKEHVETITV